MARLRMSGTALAALLLAAADLSAQTIRTAPDYRPGQQFRLLLMQTTEDARDNPPRKTYEMPVALRVVRRGTAGTELEWVAGKPLRRQDSPPADPVLELAEKVFENLRLTVRIDPAGRYQGIANEADLLARLQTFLLLLIPQSAANISDPQQRERTIEALRKVLTPQFLLSAARKEVDLYFGLSGLPLDAGVPLRIKTSAMNPFGSAGVLEGAMEITPLVANPDSGEVMVEFRQEFDAAAMLGPATAARNAPGPSWTLSDSGDYVLELETGAVKRVRHVRILRRNGEPVRVETTELTRQ
ncbi:MAG TPA: hypothetical protein VNN17_09390 [Terriglobia bacterium]|nr:hypothetical protein [Terriglobia bacterium]